MRKIGWIAVIALVLPLLAGAMSWAQQPEEPNPPASTEDVEIMEAPEPPDAAELARQAAMARTLDLSGRLEGADAVTTALALAEGSPDSLGVDAEAMSGLLKAAVAVLTVNGRMAEADAAFRKRVALSLISVDGSTREKDVLWADRQEEYAAWLVSRERFGDAARAQAEALEVYRSQLGGQNLAMEPHLSAYLEWAVAAGELSGPALALREDEVARLRERRERGVGKSMQALAGETRPQIAPGSAPVRRVRVYYATDRAESPRGVGGDRYYNSTPGVLSYGFVDLQVPVRPEPARPWNDPIFRIEVTPDRLKQTIPLAHRRLTRAAALDEIQRTANGREILIYVHGFKNSFIDAARVAANLHVDLDVRGVTVFYSWPSQYEVGGYFRDARIAEDNDADRAGKLRDLINALAAQNPNSRIYLVAHSMGNRIAAEAIAKLAPTPTGRRPLKHVILASPDIAVPTLARLAPDLRSKTGSLTIYASTRDGALLASHMAHGCPTLLAPHCPRAGRPLTVPRSVGADRLDTTLAPLRLDRLTADPLGHDDFIRSALTDMRALIWMDFPVTRRCFLSQQAGYHRFTDASCHLAAFADAAALWRRSENPNQAINLARRKMNDSGLAAQKTHWTEVKLLLEAWR